MALLTKSKVAVITNKNVESYSKSRSLPQHRSNNSNHCHTVTDFCACGSNCIKLINHATVLLQIHLSEPASLEQRKVLRVLTLSKSAEDMPLSSLTLAGGIGVFLTGLDLGKLEALLLLGPWINSRT